VELGDARWPGSGGGAGELGRCPMKVTTLGSLIGWAHLSARGRRRPNRTSGAKAESDKRSRRRADWAGQGGRRWAATGLENKGGGRAEIKKKNFRIKNWIFEFTKALEICTRRFRRNFDMRIFPKFF
jgi:hypothetical protein